MIVHQNGFLRPWAKTSQAEYDAAKAELNARISNNVAAPGTQESLLRWITALENGQPNYEEMSPALATAAHQQWPRTKLMVERWGLLQSLSFEHVAPNGLDVYLATFEHAMLQIQIAPLAADGTVTGRSWRTL